MAETIRQATMLPARVEIGVPAEDQFVMWASRSDRTEPRGRRPGRGRIAIRESTRRPVPRG
ncbi:hypothetical protein PUR59_10800 [Streptomyces sp. SP18ES09]|nr:hypothetical protein [Streptomyces sp. SP18ES09]